MRDADWHERIPDPLQHAFRTLTTAVKNWLQEIFEYFTAPGLL